MDSARRSVITIALLLFVASVMLLGCGRKRLDQEYVAFRLHSRWEFAGEIRSIEVIEESSNEDTDYVVQVATRSQRTLLANVSDIQGRLRLAGLDASSLGHVRIRFDPPIPILPQKLQVGDTEQWEAVEVREGDASWHCRVRLQTTILKPLPVAAYNSTFEDIIRVRVDYAYEEPSITPFLASESEWWFARGVGIVRYQLGSRPYEDVVSYDIP